MKFDIKKTINRCKDMYLQRIINKLGSYNSYLIFEEMTKEEYKTFLDIPGEKPEQIKEWYSLFNGGILFDTLFLSTKRMLTDCGLIKCISFKYLYGRRCVNDMELPDYMTVFAVSSFGDVYCYNNKGLNNIYQWSIAEHRLIYEWPKFLFWISDEIDTAIDLVNDDKLLPIGYNLD